jgi:sulfur-oxidizing protein SoxY
MFSRRDTLAIGMGSVAAVALPVPAVAFQNEARALIESFTGGAPIGEGGITLSLPDIAENGASVPVEVEAPDATAIILVGPENMQPEICTVHFGPLAGARRLFTRIRMAQSQDIIAIARLSDGSFVQTSQHVDVIVGGCVITG